MKMQRKKDTSQDDNSFFQYRLQWLLEHIIFEMWDNTIQLRTSEELDIKNCFLQEGLI